MHEKRVTTNLIRIAIQTLQIIVNFIQRFLIVSGSFCHPLKIEAANFEFHEDGGITNKELLMRSRPLLLFRALNLTQKAERTTTRSTEKKIQFCSQHHSWFITCFKSYTVF